MIIKASPRVLKILWGFRWVVSWFEIHGAILQLNSISLFLLVCTAEVQKSAVAYFLYDLSSLEEGSLFRLQGNSRRSFGL
mmetsp:Transcript_6469/g.13378  ORF Transcript_6469/g.13378 Transcript_6469/m.13378 type:complete len:80 (-) Transcript_6469:815-1054(-)